MVLIGRDGCASAVHNAPHLAYALWGSSTGQFVAGPEPMPA
jgi:hypothetical protein